jgi:signal transduction histidine kinase
METGLYQPKIRNWGKRLPVWLRLDVYTEPIILKQVWRGLLLLCVGLAFLYLVINLIANSMWVQPHFSRQVAFDIFVALMVLVIAGTTAYLRPHREQVELFTFFSVALALSLSSFPDVVGGHLVGLNFFAGYTGKILMPVLLLHFLVLFCRLEKELTERSFLLPLVYLPVLPALVHTTILFFHTITAQNFNVIVNGYASLYAMLGFALLIKITYQAGDYQFQKQAFVLLLGLTLFPALLLFNLIGSLNNDTLTTQIWPGYGVIGIPLAIVVAVNRYELFGIARVNRSHFFYLRAIILAVIGYVVLLGLVAPTARQVDIFDAPDMLIILEAALLFLVLRFLYRIGQHRWFEYHFHNTMEKLRASLRIFSHDLLQIKTVRELEALVSWNIPPDFGLVHAELSLNNTPSYAYALRLPLSAGQVAMGTLFLGPKINGHEFKKQELELLAELQKQISLVLFSLELDKAIQTTEQLTRLKSRFLANVTHELRTPLNGIINYIGFVVDDSWDKLNKEQQSHLEGALQAAEKLEQIINNILDMSKIEAGQMKLNFQPVNLADVMVNIKPTIDVLIKDKPVEFVTKIQPDLPLLYCDRLRLRQIIINMLSNAAKFTPQGAIQFEAYRDNGSIVLQVSDTGVGIEEVILPTIFQQFTSARLTDAHQNAGPGLSMPITKSLIELHGGQLNVQSHPGQGTIFTAILPIIPKNEVAYV